MTGLGGLGRTLLVFAAILAVVGVLLIVADRFPGSRIGRLPGDISVERGNFRFYFPLALTSLLGLAVQPILTFFMGRAPAPVESLAVFPVVMAVSFFFRAPGISFQEVAIALLGERREHLEALTRFGSTLALVATGAMALLAFTPLADVWFVTISGLSRDLADAALVPFRIALLLPPLTVLVSLQQAILVQERRTRPITIASAVEVGGLAVLFIIVGWGLGVAGAAAAFAGLGGGRIAANLYLRHVIRRLDRPS